MASRPTESNIGQPGGPDVLSRREIVTRTNTVLAEYGKLSLERIRPLVRAGEAKQVVAFVRNRPGEAQHLIDSVGENLLADEIRKIGLPARVIGENNDNFPLGADIEPRVVFAIDPFDNTSPYVRGHDTPAYTVVGAYDSKGAPIGGVIVDIMGNRIYASENGKNTVTDVETGVTKDLARSQRTDITDENISIASFVGEKEYSLPFFDAFRPMFEAMHNKGMLYPGGGAFIYALLASGAADAYVMMNEPRSEIDPGLPILLAAGGKAESINLETGKATPYKFDASLTDSDSVPLFIAYSQPEIRDAIVAAYLKGKAEAEEREVAIEFYREYQTMHEGQEYQLHGPQVN